MNRLSDRLQDPKFRAAFRAKTHRIREENDRAEKEIEELKQRTWELNRQTRQVERHSMILLTIAIGAALVTLVIACIGCSGDAFAGFDGERPDSGVEVVTFGGGGAPVRVPNGAAGDGGTGDSAEEDAGITVAEDSGTAGLGGNGGDGGAVHQDSGLEAGGGGIGGAGAGGSGGVSGECSTGAVQCIDAQRQTCVGGVWLDNGAPCPGWCLDGACVDCKPGEKSCASKSQPQTCSASGTWTSDETCEYGFTCSAGECASLGSSCGGTGLCGDECAATEACTGCTIGISPALSCRHVGDSVQWGTSSYCCPWL